MAEHLRVDLGTRSYDIRVGERLLSEAGTHIAPLLKGRSVFIVTDRNVAKNHLHRLTSVLEEKNIRTRVVLIKPGDKHKSLGEFARLMETLLEQKPDRHTTLIALGGGMVGDMTGFAASVLLRGVDFIQMPTTLLAQVDSSVGGKTGINSRWGKNLIGSFHQPVLVLADVATLNTLPKRELLCGYAEALKYGLIDDAAFFAWFEKNGAALLAGDVACRTHAIVKSCAAKAAIVTADEKEAGARALLNFGHTFGHALEAETGYSRKLLHGEAVAIGMLMAFQLSVAMGLCPPAELERVLAHYKAVGLPFSPRKIQSKWNVGSLMEHFTRDKKTKDGTLTFILTRGIGKTFITQDVSGELLRDTLAQACSA
jgi:3-dehydroquinate synthase